MSKGRRKRREQKTKKHSTGIWIDKIHSLQKGVGPNGKPMLKLTVDKGGLILSYENEQGKLKKSFATPSIWTSSDRLFDYDGYICFVDTNKMSEDHMPDKMIIPDGHTPYATGMYIFTVKQFSIEGEWARFKTDYENSIISISTFSHDSKKSNPEALGWKLAMEQLIKIGATKARIFIDSELDKLYDINKHYNEVFEFYYVSADRKPTVYNRIFSRLDKLINLTVKLDFPKFYKDKVVEYLLGNLDHLNDPKNINATYQ